MIQKYPVGLQDFQKIRSEKFLYIDKTSFVYNLADMGGYYFLSRPRRFGKSLFLSTLDYLFQGKKELFTGLYIEDKWNWEQTNPVIKISFASISHKEKGLYNAINDILDSVAISYNLSIEESSISAKFQNLIIQLSEKYNKVVILIDEYDKPIIDYLGTDTATGGVPQALENRDIMKSFYSILKDADPYIKLVFITGVSKFSRVSIFSDLNNLQDLTTNQYFSTCCGITQNELENYFAEELKTENKDKIKTWYNGYTWDLKKSVYNPFSLLNFFIQGGAYKNFWFESGTPTFLINLSKKAHKFNFDHITISETGLSAYDIEHLQLIPLMFQTGYLTLKNYNEEDRLFELGFPNQEVREAYLEVLADAYISIEDRQSLALVVQLRNALRAADFEKVERIFNTCFKSIPYTLWQNENEHFYHAIIHLVFTLLGIYVNSEVQTADGRLDALVQLPDSIFCFEFKLDGSADKALQQIKDKGYLIPYLNDNKTCFGIGLNFSKENKKVQELKWEKL